MPFCEERYGAIKKSWTHEGPSKIKNKKIWAHEGPSILKVFYILKVIAPWSQMLSCGGQSWGDPLTTLVCFRSVTTFTV